MNATVAILVLIPVALLTATISGILGMGGGSLLLAALFCFLPAGEAIPLHASVQLASNGTRIVAFRRAVDWQAFRRFALGVIPGIAIGAGILRWLGAFEAAAGASDATGAAEPYLKTLIGVYILTVALLPKPRRLPHRGVWYDFPLLGLAAGTAALTVGAVGPLIAPLFARRSFVKERLIATKAVCQMWTHLLKLPVFLMMPSFRPARFSMLLAAMAVAAIAGTIIGKRLLRFVSPAAFVTFYRVALIAAGAKVLLIDGVWRLAAGNGQ